MSADETKRHHDQRHEEEGATERSTGDLPPRAPSIEDESAVRGGLTPLDLSQQQPSPTTRQTRGEP